jgi:hypothetical protein
VDLRSVSYSLALKSHPLRSSDTLAMSCRRRLLPWQRLVERASNGIAHGDFGRGLEFAARKMACEAHS